MYTLLAIIQEILYLLTVLPTLWVLSCFTALWRQIFYSWRLPNLTQKHVLISGCDSGFGFNLALELSNIGLVVYAGCYTEKGVEELHKKRKTEYVGARSHPFLLDITTDGSVQQALTFVTNELPHGTGLWALVNNAGIATHNLPDEWLTPQHYDRVWQVNCLGHIRMTQAFKPLLKEARGRLLFILSLHSFMASNGIGPYCVSKHGIHGYARLMTVELARQVKVIVVIPGHTPTAVTNYELTEAEFRRAWEELPEKVRQSYPAGFVEKRLAFNEECLEVVLAGNKIENTVRAYVHGITARFPKPAYWLGYDAAVARFLSGCRADVHLWSSLFVRTMHHDLFY